MGCEVEEVEGWKLGHGARKCPTFAEWCRTKRNPQRTYLVLLTGHFVAVSGDKFYDTLQGPLYLDQAKGKKARVRVVIEVKSRPSKKF